MAFQVVHVQFEHYRPQNTLGVSETRPRLSWQLSNAPSKFRQTAYEVEIYETTPDNLWFSQKVESASSVLTPWLPKTALRSFQRIWARIRVFGVVVTEKNETSKLLSSSEWSTLAALETGILHRDEWRAQRICTSEPRDVNKPEPEVLFRKEFVVAATSSSGSSLRMTSARLYVTAQGVYEVEINGRRVGDHFMAPGWTNYNHKLHYQTFDVTDYLSPAGHTNCIGIRAAEGWFSGRLCFDGGRRNHYGDFTAILAQLEISSTPDDSSSSKTIIVTDDSWVATSGPIVRSEIYDGERYDATKEVPGWSKPGEQNNNNLWHKVQVLDPLPASVKLVASFKEPVRRIETIHPVQLITSPSGERIVDFGQNLVGYTRIKELPGGASKGDVITLSHAEVLEDGELGTRPLRMAKATDEYVCRGDQDHGEPESWEPRFTFHGFRYVRVRGWPKEDQNDLLASLEAVVCHTDMEANGDFACSDVLINRLYANAKWSMRGNFFSIPTDCPQRDERLGWTGDIALFGPTAMRIYNCYGLLEDYLDEVSYEQEERGGVPTFVTPNIVQDSEWWGKTIWPCAIWHDVVVLLPWALYQETGDVSILEKQFASMVQWIEVLPRDVEGKKLLWDRKGMQLGDWLDPTASPEAPHLGKTDPLLVADAFLARSLALLAKIAGILGRDADQQKYSHEAETVRVQFQDEYVTPTGRLASDSQTAFSLAIVFDLLPTATQRNRAGQQLAKLVRDNNFRVGTGFAGTPYVCEALVQTGQASVAYAMLQNKTCPSWLYPITMGATTIWERWDSMLPNGKINPGDMTSFNHFCFGAVALFLHERLAGLTSKEPGWRKMQVAPVLVASDNEKENRFAFTSAHSSHLTPYGRAASSWEIVDGGNKLNLHVDVPPLSTMDVILPYSTGTETVTLERARLLGLFWASHLLSEECMIAKAQNNKTR